MLSVKTVWRETAAIESLFHDFAVFDDRVLAEVAGDGADGGEFASAFQHSQVIHLVAAEVEVGAAGGILADQADVREDAEAGVDFLDDAGDLGPFVLVFLVGADRVVPVVFFDVVDIGGQGVTVGRGVLGGSGTAGLVAIVIVGTTALSVPGRPIHIPVIFSSSYSRGNNGIDPPIGEGASIL